MTKIDRVRMGRTLRKQKLKPELLNGKLGLDQPEHLVRTYFGLDGHHIRFSTVDVATPHAGQRNLDEHRNLIVHMAGYSGYCDLSRALQDETIVRTAHVRLLQQEVAEKIGVAEATITNWELNHTSPEVRFISRTIAFLAMLRIPTDS